MGQTVKTINPKCTVSFVIIYDWHISSLYHEMKISVVKKLKTGERRGAVSIYFTVKDIGNKEEDKDVVLIPAEDIGELCAKISTEMTDERGLKINRPRTYS